ncbi:sulfatase-like hydrolase/transferase [Paenibacillus chondroitinus]|uniref:Sulfatase-like hydrolase/transferase n=1 Tax=Paenibacillus chondroitinus TaxID=59842 RepID=A0ABU6DN58_9BACL|nr:MULTISPECIES: LTA synthase family protein [Paenibacillus]MCY9656961.1 sulfatase-like hydrolase/transferase [Paenibacillus anseongense]MEB4798757.1 sulfatase-like hydrolase/transferase [Paenibacillus chondroitinus]
MKLHLERLLQLSRQRLPFILIALIPVVIMEILSRGQYIEMFTWSYKHIIELLYNEWIVFSLLLLFIAIIGRTRIAYWILSGILLVMGLISGIKLKILGVPLTPWDIVLAGEASDMVQYIKNIFTFNVLFMIVLFLAASYFLLYRTQLFMKKVHIKERGIVAIIALGMLAAVYTDLPLPVQKWCGIKASVWNQVENTQTNGYALATFLNAKSMFSDKREGYDDKAVEAIVSNSPKPPIKAGDPNVKPNVIVVLSEAFWDPTVIKGVQFSRDPIPFFHQLQQTGTSGTMLSPQYGGGTANVEFEVLTGNSMRFLPQGSIAYNQFITNEVDSLASIYARQGYTSTAISPFYNWYFNSNRIYKDFGFSKYIPIEYFKPNYSGPYIADSEVAANIIHATELSDGPDFVFANTMENHFHFFPGKFPKNTFDVTGDMSPSSQGMLETLAQGINASDRMLKELVEYYEKKGEPTIIAFWGDHLPALGDDYATYIDTKYISGKDDPDFLKKMYSVPLVVWNNFDTERKDKLNISPSFLGPYLIELSKQQGSYYTNYLSQLSKKIPIIPPKDYFEAMHINEQDLKDYETLQYDIMFGDRHAYKDYKVPIINSKYMLGFGPILLDKVEADTQDQDISGRSSVTLMIRGSNLPPLSIVTLNGKAVPTTWQDEHMVTARVEGNMLKAGIWDIQVQVKDSKETIVGKSNTLPIEMGGR